MNKNAATKYHFALCLALVVFASFGQIQKYNHERDVRKQAALLIELVKAEQNVSSMSDVK